MKRRLWCWLLNIHAFSSLPKALRCFFCLPAVKAAVFSVQHYKDWLFYILSNRALNITRNGNKHVIKILLSMLETEIFNLVLLLIAQFLFGYAEICIFVYSCFDLMYIL